MSTVTKKPLYWPKIAPSVPLAIVHLSSFRKVLHLILCFAKSKCPAGLVMLLLYDKAHQGRALLSPRWRSQLTPLKSSCACEPTAHTPCEARSYNRLALYTCGTGAGSWAELPPCEGGNRSYKHYTCVHCTLYSCLRLSLYLFSVLPKTTVIPTQDTTKPFYPF